MMIQQEINISNKLGLHARASVKLTQTAGRFQSSIWISKGQRRVNAKSIMGVMMLAAGIGQTVLLEADGTDEKDAIDALIELIDNKFGEGE
jgi:phosphocarrier protein HPr